MTKKGSSMGGPKGPPKILRKLIAVLLAVTLVGGGVPLSAFAADKIDEFAAFYPEHIKKYLDKHADDFDY
ncbi:MAG: hypothetical protein LBB57_01365, partial [Clostridiales Family XIII bacterium]|nr:hypothetical protein [Clostridiales Family XIII bacterium]